jgi:2-methylcitrate dehydratase PrpD
VRIASSTSTLDRGISRVATGTKGATAACGATTASDFESITDALTALFVGSTFLSVDGIESKG